MPLERAEPFIVLEDGIYLRYNALPDGFDIYDFSDSAAPRLLYRSGGMLEEEERFAFENEVYGENTFGVLKITPDENGDYKNAACTWQVYAVDITGAEPFILLEEYPVFA